MSAWGNLVIGQVVKRGVVRQDTVKVRCLKMKLDTYLNKYFNTRKHYWALDENMKAKTGDIVLINRLPEKLTPLVSHEIKETVFEIGNVVDPVTGQRCRGKTFIDSELRRLEEDQIKAEKEQMPEKDVPSSSSS